MHEQQHIDINAYRVPIEQILVNCSSQALWYSVLQQMVCHKPKLYVCVRLKSRQGMFFNFDKIKI